MIAPATSDGGCVLRAGRAVTAFVTFAQQPGLRRLAGRRERPVWTAERLWVAEAGWRRGDLPEAIVAAVNRIQAQQPLASVKALRWKARACGWRRPRALKPAPARCALPPLVVTAEHCGEYARAFRLPLDLAAINRHRARAGREPFAVAP